MSSGINFDKLHEREIVSLRLHEPLRVSALASTLSFIGFKKMDDFCFFPRMDRGPAWQSETVATTTFFVNGTELSHYLEENEPDSTDARCDEIKFDYLLASLPASCIAVFVSLVRRVQERLGGQIMHLGEHVEIDLLEPIFLRYVADIHEELAEEPGSEFLRICISQLYPGTGSS